MSWVETLGTLASIIVAISLMMKNIKWLRWFNLVGATTFSFYGFLIQSWPVCGLNAFIVGINVFYLFQLHQSHSSFALFPIEKRDDPYLETFLKHYDRDIRVFHPEFSLSNVTTYKTYFVLRELLPISLFMFYKNVQGEWEIVLDYAIPAYRDFQNARFLYHQGVDAMKLGGNSYFVTFSRVAVHQAYLKKIGFKETEQVGDLVKYRYDLVVQ